MWLGKSLLSCLLMITWVFGQEIKLIKLGCQVKIQEVPWTNGMRPGVITPQNFSQFILALKCCRVKRAQVGGWNDHIGNYVLFDNGTVVPAEDLTLPNIGLFTQRSPDGTMEVICVVNPEDLNSAKCYKPTATVMNVNTCIAKLSTTEAQQAVCNSGNDGAEWTGSNESANSCCTSCASGGVCTGGSSNPPSTPNGESNPCPNPQPPSILPSPSTNTCPDAQTLLAQKEINCQKTPCGSEVECIVTSRTFIFESPGNSCQHPVLRVKSRQNKRKQEVIPLDGRPLKLVPKILCFPRRLSKIKRELQKTHDARIELYVNDRNQLFAKSGTEFFQVSMRNKKLCTREVSVKSLKKLVSRGLSNIVFAKPNSK